MPASPVTVKVTLSNAEMLTLRRKVIKEMIAHNEALLQRRLRAYGITEPEVRSFMAKTPRPKKSAISNQQ